MRQLSREEDLRNIPKSTQSHLLGLKLDVPQKVLKYSFDQLVQNHPMLRARSMHGSTFTQITSSEDSYRLRFSQYRYLDDQECARILEEAHRSISLVDGPVFSVDVYRTGGGSYVLLVGHNLIVDA